VCVVCGFLRMCVPHTLTRMPRTYTHSLPHNHESLTAHTHTAHTAHAHTAHTPLHTQATQVRAVHVRCVQCAVLLRCACASV
jgi:hypothetical protein